MIPGQSASVHRAVEWRDFAAPSFLAAASLLLAMLAWAYGNQFHNPFQFDDSHTIVSNAAIRDLHNIPRFFTDGTTASTLPANQSWRPVLTTLNAIDTWLSGGVPNPLWFHVSIFASYVLLGVVLFFVYLHVLRRSLGDTASARWAALIGTGWFWMHTASPEISRRVKSGVSKRPFWYACYVEGSMALRAGGVMSIREVREAFLVPAATPSAARGNVVSVVARDRLRRSAHQQRVSSSGAWRGPAQTARRTDSHWRARARRCGP